MLDKDTLVKVTNRSYGSVGYAIADLGIRREYQPNETKEVTVEEMRKLSYLPGGRKTIEKYLIIDNEDLVSELLGEVEPEYYYTKDDVYRLLTEGSVEQLEDCLDFADGGVIDLVKKVAVEIELNDVRKRQVILAHTNFNVDSAIFVNQAVQEDEDIPVHTTRRAAPIKHQDASQKQRRTNPQKYKVTSIKE